jgi:hypothetical protein
MPKAIEGRRLTLSKVAEVLEATDILRGSREVVIVVIVVGLRPPAKRADCRCCRGCPVFAACGGVSGGRLRWPVAEVLEATGIMRGSSASRREKVVGLLRMLSGCADLDD